MADDEFYHGLNQKPPHVLSEKTHSMHFTKAEAWSIINAFDQGFTPEGMEEADKSAGEKLRKLLAKFND